MAVTSYKWTSGRGNTWFVAIQMAEDCNKPFVKVQQSWQNPLHNIEKWYSNNIAETGRLVICVFDDVRIYMRPRNVLGN